MTKLNAKVPYNVEIAGHGRDALENIEAAGGHFGYAEATEVSLAQVLAKSGADYSGLPDSMLKMNIRVPYNVEMAIHGSAALSDVEAAGGHFE